MSQPTVSYRKFLEARQDAGRARRISEQRASVIGAQAEEIARLREELAALKEKLRINPLLRHLALRLRIPQSEVLELFYKFYDKQGQ
jgi:hypothetical protein